VRTEIEITDHRLQPQPSGYRAGSIALLTLLGMIALALLGCTAAHAQPTEWRSYPFGSGVPTAH
jgi:hypothetical protein